LKVTSKYKTAPWRKNDTCWQDGEFNTITQPSKQENMKTHSKSIDKNGIVTTGII